MDNSSKPLPLAINKINHPVANLFGVKLYIARVDEINPLASGNAIYNFTPNLEYAKQQGINRLLSFGGAFSNHIHALALYAGKEGFETLGIIRGEPQYANNPTLLDVQRAGMKLKFVNRQQYRQRHDKKYLEQLLVKYPDTLIIPEGGSSQSAVTSCRQLMREINQIKKCDFVVAACGTGATFSGLVCGLDDDQTAIGFSALLDQSLESRINQFIINEGYMYKKYKIRSAAFGGFAKLNKEVFDFTMSWLSQTNILLDPIYTSKMVLELINQLENNEFSRGSTICIVHSGGLQGWRGMKRQVIKLGGEESWVMRIGKNLDVNEVNDSRMEAVECYRYLGVDI